MKRDRSNRWLVQLLAGVLVFTLFFAVTHVSADESSTSSGVKVVTSFPDVPRSHPQYTAISYLSQAGVLKGYDDGSFKPDNPINRAEVLKVILAGSNVATPETAGENPFPDVDKGAWFARFVLKAKELGIVKGNDADGTFTPGRQVNKAELIKMLLMANQVNIQAVQATDQQFSDVPADQWFAPYMRAAAALGLITKNAQGQLEPGKNSTRAEVAEVLYLLNIIRKGNDTQFLLNRAEAEMAQIEVYVAANRVELAKRASELAVDLTQQAYKNLADNNVVVGAAKLARAYDWLVDAFILGIQKNYIESAKKANDAIDKADEAYQANNATQPIARHIKDRAREILAQVGGKEE